MFETYNLKSTPEEVSVIVLKSAYLRKLFVKSAPEVFVVFA